MVLTKLIKLIKIYDNFSEIAIFSVEISIKPHRGNLATVVELFFFFFLHNLPVNDFCS